MTFSLRGFNSVCDAIQDAIVLKTGHARILQFDNRGRPSRDIDGKLQYRAPTPRGDQLAMADLPVLARCYLQACGMSEESCFRLGDGEAVSLLNSRNLRRAYPDVFALSQSTSDFGSILSAALNTSLRQFYVEAPKTWPIWAKQTTTPDFKPVNRASISESPSLQPINEGDGLQYVTLEDGKETYALVEYNAGIKITRRAIVNDRLKAFTAIPMLQAMAAVRKEEDLAYAILTGNPEMADGEDLFSAAHANHKSSAGNPPYTVAAVNDLWTLMRKQKGPLGESRLNLRPAFIICPTALEIGAKQFFASTVDPSKNNETNNPFANQMTVVGDSRLDDASSTEWYAAADYRAGQVDTIEICFLESEPMPVLRQETEFDTEDMKFAVRHTVAAAALDYRGLAKSKGAA